MFTLVVGLCLLLNVVLGTTLLRLALIVQLLVVCLAFLVSSETSDSAANSSLDTVSHAMAVVVQLALCLLLLALEVLLTSRLL